jgi:hypothetical protein
MAVRTLKCEMCGEIFLSYRSNIKYCSDACRSSVKRTYPSKKRERGEVTTPSTTLAEINQQARDAGMSYGKYVGMLWLKEHQW